MNRDTDTDDRLVAIETKLAHQELLVDELNKVLTDQQARLSQLEEHARNLTERLQAIGESAVPGGPDDERPPHY